MRVNVNVYLPDDLARRAKEAKLPFSRLLREAVSIELERRKDVTETLQMSYETYLDLADGDGHRYQGKLTGRQIAMEGKIRVFVTDDERVLLYDGDVLGYRLIEDPVVDLRFLNRGAYVVAMQMLGLSPIVDL